MYLFPFDIVKQGSRVILYGGGLVCRDYVKQISALNWCNILFVADKNYNNMQVSIDKINIHSPEIITAHNFDYLVVSAANECKLSILNDIKQLGIADRYIVDRITYINPDNINSYSQFGEDCIIMNIFRQLGIEHPSYIDVGAHHPYIISNTALLYKNGSRGINIEADAELIQVFEQERPEDINLNIAIGDKCGHLPYYKVGAIFTLSYDLALHWQITHQSENLQIEKYKEIPVFTLTDIINQYNNGVFPDFMNIDIEGLDYDVLRSCDFTNGKPLVICAELSNEKADDMMREKGFIRFCRTHCNTIYVREIILAQIIGRGCNL